MTTVTGLTAERMLEIEAASVVDGDVVGSNLILTKHDGTQIDAGSVIGPPGPQGPAGSVVPSGVLHDYAGATAPTGYLLCDGTSYATATYPNLFAAIGYAYGGSGANFNVPDFRGRVSVGKGTHADVDTLGDNDGVALANRSPKHKHSVTDPGHTHTYWTETVTPGGTVGFAFSGGSSNRQPANARTGVTGAPPPGGSGVAEPSGITVTPGGNPPDHTPAYLVVNKIIKT